MIVTKKVDVKIVKSNIEHYKSLNLDISFNLLDVIGIDPCNLTPGSNQKVDVKCEICEKIKNIVYRDYRKCKLNHNIYVCSSCSNHKYKITCLERYGVETTFKDKNTHDKIIKTNIERYGVDNPFKSPDIQNKIKITNFQKYGFENPLKNEEILNKTKNTNIERYGVYNLFSNKSPFREEIDRKLKLVLNTEDVRKKKQNTCLVKYGSKSPMQNIEIFEKTQKSSYYLLVYKDTNITYRGTYELDFIEFCIKHNINIEQLKIGIEYKYENENRIYFPDFYYKPLNLIIEIKSIYTYYADFYKNMEKQDSCINKGYGFIFIIDKDYSDFLKLINL